MTLLLLYDSVIERVLSTMWLLTGLDFRVNIGDQPEPNKTKTVLLIVLPIVLLFALVYSIDFYLYRRKKTQSRSYWREASRKLRVLPHLVTDTFVTETTKPWKKSTKRSSILSHIKSRTVRPSIGKRQKTVFSLNNPEMFSAATLMPIHAGGSHVTRNDNQVSHSEISIDSALHTCPEISRGKSTSMETKTYKSDNHIPVKDG